MLEMSDDSWTYYLVKTGELAGQDACIVAEACYRAKQANTDKQLTQQQGTLRHRLVCYKDSL
jgi:hypothetical protein